MSIILTHLCADEIIGQLALDLPPSGYAPRNVDLVNCLLTSRTVHVATINTLYKHITVPHSQIFSKFLSHISQRPGLGTLVRRLDLSHFTSIGLGRTRHQNTEIQNLTSKTLLKCLEFTPAIQEVLLTEHLDDDVDEHVLRKLFFDLPQLRAVDFCAAASTSFVQAFTSAVTALGNTPSTNLRIRRVGLHECFTLPNPAIETFLSRLPQLTHLDLSHTRVTDDALASIPDTAKLTHLNLGRCSQITGAGVVDFLTTSPAASELIYLNLASDLSRHRLLREEDLTRLLPALPSTLRSLNLNGAKIGHQHLPALLPLTKHLEELGVSNAELSLDDINSLFIPPTTASPDPYLTEPAAPQWQPSTLHYIDLTSVQSISQASLFGSKCTLLSTATMPLEVLELGPKAISGLRECRNTNKRLGWCVKELGRRGWYVRESGGDASGKSGRRSWKMGAMWWGMTKCPVDWGEVGGLYGHYMFKK